VTIPWDADRLADRVKNIKNSAEQDKELRKFFKAVCLGHFDDPVIITDKFGAILAWHLPGILSPARIVRVHFGSICQQLKLKAGRDQHLHRHNISQST
jgi:hypothetical protein